MPFDLSRALPYLSPAYSVEDTAPIHAYGSRDGPIARTFSASIIVNYIIDEPGALVFVRERDVDAEKRDDLHAQAIENLRRHIARRKLRFEPNGPLHQARLDGEHDASLLLLDELWDPPTRIADLDGELVVAVPARSVLLFTGSALPGGIEGMQTAVARTTDRELSPELLVRRSGMWAPYKGR